jgi:hypothetical protein
MTELVRRPPRDAMSRTSAALPLVVLDEMQNSLGVEMPNG